MLSQVERGETSPTLAGRGRIAAGLELASRSFCASTRTASVTIVRAGERAAGGTPRAATATSAQPPLPGQRLELSRHTLAPGADTGGPGDPPMHEPGSREMRSSSRAGDAVCDGARTSSAPATA